MLRRQDSTKAGWEASGSYWQNRVTLVLSGTISLAMMSVDVRPSRKASFLAISAPLFNKKLAMISGCRRLITVNAQVTPARALRREISSGGSLSADSKGENPGTILIGENTMARPAPCQKYWAASGSRAASRCETGP